MKKALYIHSNTFNNSKFNLHVKNKNKQKKKKNLLVLIKVNPLKCIKVPSCNTNMHPCRLTHTHTYHQLHAQDVCGNVLFKLFNEVIYIS